MSTDNFGALGADFFIKTYDKGSTMSQADLDALVQYVQLATTIIAIGDFTPGEQDSVWMILERVDVPSAPGYTVTNNTDVTMTSSGMVTINSMPWTKITGKPVLFSGDYNDLTNKPTLFTANQTVNTSDSVSFNRLTVTGASGIEGGEIQLAKAPNSTIAGDVIIDVYENKLRFFEGGGNGRGFYLDLTTGANNTSTNIMSGGDSFSGSYNDLTDKPALFSGAYDDLTGKPAAQILQAPQWNALHNLGTGNRYLVGDLVYNSGNIYQAIADNESQYTAVGDATYWRNLGTGIRLQTDYLDLANKPSIPTSFSSLVNGSFTTNLGTDGDLTAPRNIILNNPVTTVIESVTGTVADSTGNPFTFRILKSANPQLIIPFSDPNFVLKWTGSDAGSAAAGAQAPGGQGPSSLVSDDGTYWNFNSWFGLNTSRPNTGTEFTVEYGVVVSDTTISTTATNLVIEADTEQWKFGTDGVLTLPDTSVISSYKPVTVIAGPTGVQTIQDNASATRLTFIESVDSIGAFANSTFTVPYAGYYQFNITVYFTSNVTLTDGFLVIVNTTSGLNELDTLYYGAHTGRVINGSSMQYLTAGDTVAIFFRQVSGNVVDIGSSSRLTIHRVSIS